MKKLWVLLIVELLIFGGIVFLKYSVNDSINVEKEEQLVGADEDEHGCKGSAGYSWCELKQKCLRTWEELCKEESSLTIDEIVRSSITKVELFNKWDNKIFEQGTTRCGQVEMYSPDFKLSEGYPVLEQGSEVIVRVCTTEFTDVEKLFDSNTLVKQISQGKENIKIGEIPAIRYNYSYEGTIATDTIFIKGDYEYSFKLRYMDEQKKTEYWEEYVRLVAAFSN